MIATTNSIVALLSAAVTLAFTGCLVSTETIPGEQGASGETGPQGPPGTSPWQEADQSIYYLDGRVGIGTPTPEYLLDIHENADAHQRIRYANLSNGPSSAAIIDLTAGVDTDDCALSLSRSAMGNKEQFYDPPLTGGGFGGILDNCAQGKGLLIATASPDGVLVFATDGKQRMRVTSDGKFGIGTTLPAAAFQVAGNSTPPLGGACVDSDWYDENTDGKVDNGECKVTSMAVQSDGNVGIGVRQPVATLDVSGTARLKRYSSEPTSCDQEHDGTLALTSQYSMCVCHGSIGEWRNTASPSTPGCPW